MRTAPLHAPGDLHEQTPQQCRPLLADPTLSAHRPRFELTRDQAGVRADLASRAEPICAIDCRDDQFSQSSADARDTLQPLDTLVACRESIQPLLDLLQQLVDLSQSRQLAL